MYRRTALGQQEILERKCKISSRARTLLLLIESYDLDRLDRKIANTENFEILIALGLITTKTDPHAVQMETEIHIQTQVVEPLLETEYLSTTFSRLRAIKDKISNIKRPAKNTDVDEIQPSQQALTPSKIIDHPINSPTSTENLTIVTTQAHTKLAIAEDSAQQNLEEEFPPLGFNDIKFIMQDTLRQYCGLMAKHLIHAIEEAKTTQELRLHQKKWLTDLFETRISHQNLTTLKKQINLSIQYLESNTQHSK